MKLLVLLYLEDDDRTVLSLLRAHGVVAWSRLSVEGHGPGTPGWFAEVAPYRSRMILTLVPEGQAGELMDAVRGCAECQDPAHPVHAMQVGVEAVARSGGN